MAHRVSGRTQGDREDSRWAADRSARRHVVHRGFSSFTVFLFVCALLIANSRSIPAQDDQATPPAATPAGVAARPDLSLRGVVDELPPPPAVVELSRVHLASGAAWEIVAPGPVLYGVEEGALGIRVDGPAVLTRAATDGIPSVAEAATPGVDFTLRLGDQMVVAAGTSHILGNDGRAPTAFLSVVIFPVASAIPSWLPEAERPPGVDVQPLAADVTAATDAAATGPVEIAVTRTTLEAGEDFVLSPSDFALLLVESGAVVVTPDQGPAQEQTSGVGDVVRLDPGTGGTARNGGETPAVLLTVRIDAGAAEEASPSATPST